MQHSLVWGVLLLCGSCGSDPASGAGDAANGDAAGGDAGELDAFDAEPAATKLEYTMLGIHPQAMQQSTASGKGLDELAAWNGKLYAGYGDWNANTGPIAITPFDPATETFASAPLLVEQTEAIDRLRVINNKLFAPMTDPRPSNGGYAWGQLSGSTEMWAETLPVNAVHVMDMCSLDGTDLWMAGAVVTSSTTSDAVMWRSTNGGTNWTEAHRGSGVTIGRFYFCASLDGVLWAAETAQTQSHRFDGNTWSRGPVLPISLTAAPIQFLDKLVWRTNVTHLQLFDGATSSTSMDLPEQIRDIAVDGDKLYALGANGRIDWTTDLVTWHGLPAATPMSNVLSLAVLNGKLYVGGAGSELYLATPVL